MAVTVMMIRVKYLKKILIIKHLIDTCVRFLSENVEVNFDFHLLFIIIVNVDIENYNKKLSHHHHLTRIIENST